MADHPYDETRKKNQPLSRNLFARIEEDILTGKLASGSKLTEKKICDEYNVSRTPVRETMMRLEAEGLVVVKPHCGAVVFDISEEQLTEIYEIRILLEQYCAEKACRLATDEQIDNVERLSLGMQEYPSNSRQFMEADRIFHRGFCSISGCTSSIEILETLWTRCDAFKAIYYSLDGKARDTLNEHAKIVQALRARDADAMKRAISDHLEDVVKANVARIRSDRVAKAE